MNKNCGGDGCGGSCGSCAQNKLCQVGQCTCAGNAENTDPLCSDGLDNDCNGLTDCADPNCAAMRCSLKGGLFCKGAQCASGCRIAGVFYAAGTTNPLNGCQDCEPQRNDAAWSNLAGTACANGICNGGGCCTGCWDGLSCHPGGSIFHCGVAGGACASCNSNKPCVSDGCNAGVCSHNNVANGLVCPTGIDCTTGLCSNGTCASTPVANGTACRGADCAALQNCGACNTGCVPYQVCNNGVCGGSVQSYQCCPSLFTCDNSSGFAQCVD